MKKSISKKSMILILTLILISLFIIITYPVSAENPVYVDDDFDDTNPGWGVTNFSNIQNGIDAVDDNGTVYVYTGTYSGFIIVNKTITISGENEDSVWVSGPFYVTGDNVLIEHITIANVSGGDFPSGVYDESSNSIYRNLHLFNNTRGIQLSSLSYNTSITENLFEENNYGIYSYETTPYASISTNTFENNTFGILIDSSQFYTIFHNTIINNDEVGFSLLSSNDNLIYDNFFENSFNVDSGGGINNLWNISKTEGINIIGGPYLGGNFWNDYSGIDADGDSLGDTPYIINEESDMLPLKLPNLKLYVDDDAELSWYNETNVQTIQEAVNNASTGAEIFVYSGTYFGNIQITKTINLLGENNFTTIINGLIQYDDVSSGNISKFNITYSGGDYNSGLELWGTNNVNISDNIIANASGILLDCNSHNNTIYNNLIENNYVGIELDMECFSSCENNTIKNNIVINNDVGIKIDSSINNLIYNNYFDNNLNNSQIVMEAPGINYWNITKTPGLNIIGGQYLGGNYWSDYTGVDFDGDGIGESDYFVSGSDLFIDYLPLTDNINLPPFLGNPEPEDGSTIDPLEFDWSIEINDPGWGVFSWNISCSNGQSNHSSEDSNGTKILHLSGLSYDTSYTISVNVFDYYQWTNETFTFKTKEKKNKQNYPPTAIIDETYFGFPGEKINFDGSKSHDLDGYIASYTWDFGDGTTLQGKVVTHSYSKQGNYNVRLTIFDNDGASDTESSNVIITKANIPPVLNLSNETSTGKLSVNIIITVTDKDGDSIDCSINWDDGSSPTSLQLNSNQTVTETHIYSTYGTYSIHVTAYDGSTETSDTESITISTDNNQEENTNSNGFIKIITNDEPFLDNQIDSRSIFGGYLDKQYAILVATILSIILLFLLNFLIEFFSDYSSERAIEHRKNRKSKVTPKKGKTSQLSKFLSMNELFAIIITTLILSFVLTWTWAPDLAIFWETFIIFLIIVVIIFFIREGLRSYLCFKLKFDSEFYVWPLGAIMMIVSTAIGNTFSLAANHHYCEEDIKKCGKVSFIVSIVMYMIVAIMFLLNLFYHSAILQMIIIVTILNLFIDLFPLNPMDGHEIRHWNIFLWASLYIVVIISYVTVYFNLLT